MRQEFPAQQWLVEGIVPEGFTILAAAPKAGKSWWVLSLAISIAHGARAFGVLPTGRPRPVLYAALEDGPRRLQQRAFSLGLAEDDADDRLQFVNDPTRVIERCREFVADHASDQPLVIVDTLGRVALPPAGNDNQYLRDYQQGAALKRIVDPVPGAALVAAHHTRKAESPDFLDAVSGTQGWAGSADTILVLRRSRMERSASLAVTSRDAPEQVVAMQQLAAGGWVLDGETLGASAALARERSARSGVGDSMGRLVAQVMQHPEGASPTQLKAELPDLGNKVNEYLGRAVAAGRIRRIGRGVYAPALAIDP